jgi:hypothetical protein
VGELRAQHQAMGERLDARTRDVAAAERLAREREAELEDVRSFLKRKSQEARPSPPLYCGTRALTVGWGQASSLDDERRATQQRLRETQGYADSVGADLQQQQARIRQLEAELGAKADAAARLEQTVLVRAPRRYQ